MAIKNKITVFYEEGSTKSFADFSRHLEKFNWQIHGENLSAVSAVKRGWLAVWDMFWYKLVSSAFVSSLSEGIFNWVRKQFVRMRAKAALVNLRKFQPPIILATSYVSVLVAAYFKHRTFYRGKLVAALPGFGLNPLWVQKEIDLYICNSERQVELLRQRQVDSSKIAIIKPDIDQEFLKDLSKGDALSELGLLTTMPVVVMMSESVGAEILKESFLKLIRLSQSCQVAIFSGNGSDFRSKVEKITAPVRHPVKVFSDPADLPKLLASAVAVIGPLRPDRLAEAAARRLPIIITDSDLCVEAPAMRYLVEQNAVAFGRIPAETVFLAETILEGRKITNPKAAYELLVEPKNSMLFTDALATINPSAPQERMQP